MTITKIRQQSSEYLFIERINLLHVLILLSFEHEKKIIRMMNILDNVRASNSTLNAKVHIISPILNSQQIPLSLYLLSSRFPPGGGMPGNP